MSDKEPLGLEYAKSFGLALDRLRRDEVRKQIEAHKFDALSWADFLISIEQENDRTTGILLFSFFEDVSLEIFRSHFRNQAEKLLTRNGPLGTAHARLLIADALGWIEDRTFGTMECLRKIRNEFAHKITVDAFSQEPVSNFIDNMFHAEELFYNSPDSFDMIPQEQLSERNLYFIRATFGLGETLIGLIARRPAIHAGMNADAAYADGLKDTPRLVKEIQAATLNTMCRHVATAETIKRVDSEHKDVSEIIDKWVKRMDETSSENDSK